MQIKITALASFFFLAAVPLHTEAATEQFLAIVGTWSGDDSYRVDCPTCDTDDLSFNSFYISTADTLSIELASDPCPPGEPGVTYYDYTLLSYYSGPWNDPGVADLDLPSPYREQRGKMGVYYADGGKWEFNHVVTYLRIWDEKKKEYQEGEYRAFGGTPMYFPPRWEREIKMFAGWLALGLGHWDRDVGDDLYEGIYRRVDE